MHDRTQESKDHTTHCSYAYMPGPKDMQVSGGTQEVSGVHKRSLGYTTGQRGTQRSVGYTRGQWGEYVGAALMGAARLAK